MRNMFKVEIQEINSSQNCKIIYASKNASEKPGFMGCG